MRPLPSKAARRAALRARRFWRRTGLVIGHRGAAGLAPENTLPGFHRAVAEGADAVELDLYWHDGELLVIHDARLDRTTNGRGPLSARPLTALRELDAGQGARIPLLAEVLALLPERMGVNLELKGPATARPVAALIDELQPRQPLLVSSFEHDQLHEFRQLDALTPVAPLFHRRPGNAASVARALDACCVNLNARLATPERVAALREMGFRVLVYTVNDPARATSLAQRGVSGLFTDRPDRVTAALWAAVG